jgi:hypothetical protein
MSGSEQIAMRKEYKRSKYVRRISGGDCIGRHSNSHISLFTNKKRGKQGTIVINGLPSGGYSVYPITWLSAELREKECRKHFEKLLAKVPPVTGR